MIKPLTALPVLVLLASSNAWADRLVTVDGRILEVDRARLEGDHYRLEFPPGVVLCPVSLVASVEIEGNMEDYEPKDEREREFLQKGYVRYQDKWISKREYQRIIDEKAEKTRARTAEIALHSDFENAWEEESKHFVLRSNTSKELLAYYTEMLEAFYSLMDDRIGIKPTPTMKRTKMSVNIFKSHAELIEHSKRTESPDSDDEEEDGDMLLGYFSSVEQSLNFYHDYKDPGLSQVTALHECTHLLTYLIDQDYWAQIWINEAAAEYFGTANIVRDKRGRMQIEPGRVQMEQVLTMQEAIREKEHTPLAELFLTDDEKFSAFHYANAWSFVYFLQNTEEYGKNFRRFFKDLYTLKLKGYRAETIAMGFRDKTGMRKRYSPEDIQSALLDKLKVKDLDALEAEWLAFVAAIEINGPEAKFKRGQRRVFYGQGTPQEALKDLNEAIAGGYDTAEAYLARGTANLYAGEWDAAIADMRRAVEKNPLDGNYRVELAQLLSGWFGDDDELLGDPETIDEAQLNFDLAALLDPENDRFRQLAEGFRKLRK